MASPSIVFLDKVLSSSEIISKPLNFERYMDMEAELNQENLIDFIKFRAAQYKYELNKGVSIPLWNKTTYAIITF